MSQARNDAMKSEFARQRRYEAGRPWLLGLTSLLFFATVPVAERSGWLTSISSNPELLVDYMVNVLSTLAAIFAALAIASLDRVRQIDAMVLLLDAMQFQREEALTEARQQTDSLVRKMTESNASLQRQMAMLTAEQALSESPAKERSIDVETETADAPYGDPLPPVAARGSAVSHVATDEGHEPALWSEFVRDLLFALEKLPLEKLSLSKEQARPLRELLRSFQLRLEQSEQEAS